jgi:hypothetical protein
VLDAERIGRATVLVPAAAQGVSDRRASTAGRGIPPLMPNMRHRPLRPGQQMRLGACWSRRILPPITHPDVDAVVVLLAVAFAGYGFLVAKFSPEQ